MDEITQRLSAEKRKSLRLKMMKVVDESCDFFFQFPKLEKLKAGNSIAIFEGLVVYIQINIHTFTYCMCMYLCIFFTPKS